MSSQVFFNKTNGKKKDLLDVIYSNVNKSKKYDLHIASCYLSNDLSKLELNKFILSISKNIKINSVTLYVDSRQVIRSGIHKVKEFILCKISKRITSVYFYVIDGNTLFHTKALSLISCNDPKTGFLFIGSSNFSNSGIFGNYGNYESGLFSTNIDDVKSFLSSLDRIPNKCTLEQFENKKLDESSYTFKYSIVKNGVFIHKWQQTLSQYFSIRYTLSEKGKEEVVSDTFKSFGFTIESETISRQFLDIKNIPSITNESFNNIRRKGIETYLGYWIPQCLICNISDDEIPEGTKENIRRFLIHQIEKNRNEIVSVYKDLVEKDLIQISEKDSIDLLNEKVTELFSEKSKEKLRRLLKKYDRFELPYDFNQKEEIDKLYNILKGSIELTKRKNESKKILEKAILDKRPDYLNKCITDVTTRG